MIRLISAQESAKYLGLSKTTFLRMVKDHSLPQPIRITERQIVWDKNDLDSYIEHIKSEKTPDSAEKGGVLGGFHQYTMIFCSQC